MLRIERQPHLMSNTKPKESEEVKSSYTIPTCFTDVYFNSFFPRTARLWNSLLIESFPLTYNLNGFKSRNNRHFLTVGSF